MRPKMGNSQVRDITIRPRAGWKAHASGMNMMASVTHLVRVCEPWNSPRYEMLAA